MRKLMKNFPSVLNVQIVWGIIDLAKDYENFIVASLYYWLTFYEFSWILDMWFVIYEFFIITALILFIISIIYLIFEN